MPFICTITIYTSCSGIMRHRRLLKVILHMGTRAPRYIWQMIDTLFDSLSFHALLYGNFGSESEPMAGFFYLPPSCFLPNMKSLCYIRVHHASIQNRGMDKIDQQFHSFGGGRVTKSLFPIFLLPLLDRCELFCFQPLNSFFFMPF